MAEHTSLWEALLAVQKEGISLQKNAINPHFKNKYISLDTLMGQVLPVLNENGIVLLQQPTVVSGEPGLTTSLTLAATGESVVDTMPLILGKDDPQGQGAAITYARRYSLMSILGLVADEDTDGEGVKSRGVVRRGAGRKAATTPATATDSTAGGGTVSGGGYSIPTDAGF